MTPEVHFSCFPSDGFNYLRTVCSRVWSSGCFCRVVIITVAKAKAHPQISWNWKWYGNVHWRLFLIITEFDTLTLDRILLWNNSVFLGGAFYTHIDGVSGVRTRNYTEKTGNRIRKCQTWALVTCRNVLASEVWSNAFKHWMDHAKRKKKGPTLY